MELDYATPSKPASKAPVIVGWVLTVLPAAMLVLSAVMKFILPPAAQEGNKHLGWSDKLATPLGIVELIATALFLIPQTAVLGAILLTGYLGGAIATHVRVGDPFIIPAVMGVVIWLALFLREPRLRVLVPLRK